MRKVIIVLAAAAALTGALSVDALAQSRGAPIGPLGQVFDGVNPVDHPNIFGKGAQNAYGYVGAPHARTQHSRGNERR